MKVAVTGVGLLCALGDDPARARSGLYAGECGLVPLGEPGHEDILGGRVPKVDLKPWLRRRKDRKLLPRAAQLALPVAGTALGDWAGNREELGLFVGVRREPPDDGEADPAMAASERDGRLDTALLAGAGRDLYPPLLPLKTLPNMVLAHISINLGIRGPADTCAGGPAAGAQAVRMALHAVSEGRCPAALAVVADCQIDGGSLRDRARVGDLAPGGEGAVALMIEPMGATNALFHLEDGGAGGSRQPWPWHFEAALGDCGTANPGLALALGAVEACGVAHGGAWARILRA